jgi:hypothetical protein
MIGTYGSVAIFTDDANLGYWQSQSLDAGVSPIVAVPTLGFSKVQLVWDRTTPVGTREDVMVASLNYCQAAATACTPLNNTDKIAMEGLLNTWWGTYKAFCSTQYTLREYRWYDYQPISTRPGPVDRVTAVAVAGTSANTRFPDQLAVTQTFKTASRKHWGRWYLPFPDPSRVDTTYGRLTNAFCTSVQAATILPLRAAGGSGIINPCVPSIRYHGVLLLKELQTDNIADIIRRRRAKVATFRASNTS